MGLPVYKFLAATNVNDIVPRYLDSGIFNPKMSIQTISNAMDVGSPSNFSRILDLYSFTWNNIKSDIVGFSFNDKVTKECIAEVFQKYKYVLDPHSAVGYLALINFLKSNPDLIGIILETAHPSKFIDTVEPLINSKVTIPSRLSSLSKKKKIRTKLPNKFDVFKSYLFDTFK